MTEHAILDQFIDRIMTIDAPSPTAFGYGMPGNAGIAAGPGGSITSGMDVTWQLKKKAAEFVGTAYKSGAPQDNLRKLTNELEGLLLSEQLVNVLNEKQVNLLIDELHQIKE